MKLPRSIPKTSETLCCLNILQIAELREWTPPPLDIGHHKGRIKEQKTAEILRIVVATSPLLAVSLCMYIQYVVFNMKLDDRG
jgi:hypothetical protein